MTRVETNLVTVFGLSAWSWLTTWPWWVDLASLCGMCVGLVAIEVMVAFIERDVRKAKRVP